MDKVFALAARPYLKARDVFDIHRLRSQAELATTVACSPADLAVRLATYPSQTAQHWLEQAMARRVELPPKALSVQRDLKRWLPSTWSLKAAHVQAMVQASVAALDGGIVSMQALVASRPARAPAKRPPR